MRDISSTIKKIIVYCKKEQNYSYFELREYAMKNRLDWSWALSNKNARMANAMYKHTKDYNNDLEEKMQRRFQNTICNAKKR